MIAFVNGHFLQEDKAAIQVGDLALQRGYAAFDFFRIKNNRPLFLDDHLSRFFNSAASMYLQPAQTKEGLKEVIYELMEYNNLDESGIRMILTGGYSPDSYAPVTPNFIVIQHQVRLPSDEKYTSGIKVITHEYLRDLPGVKSINYLMGVWLQQKARAQNAEDILYYKQGIVSELPRANVFIVTPDKKIVTPSENILPGITRKKLLELIAKEYLVEERPVHIEEVKNAAEVFMTSATKRLLAINQVDEVVIGNGKAGPITTLLNAAFVRLENTIAGV